MNKITVFGSSHWPGCEPVKEFLSENNIEYDYINITDSMKNLKIFLKFRDTDPYFDQIKKAGYVGLPTIMINNGEKFIEGSTEMDLEELR